RKTHESQRFLALTGRRASGRWLWSQRAGCWPVGLLGCWAVGLLGCWAAGLLGCWAAGPLGSEFAWLTPSRPAAQKPAAHYGSANATYVPPDGASFFPPPHAITTYCLPFTMYSDGVALPAAGSFVSQSSLPVDLSNTWNLLSYVVAPMNTSPFSVTTGPP